jgi:hypothetical protein
MKNDGGAAFPRAATNDDNVMRGLTNEGMSLRDWFAGQVISGTIQRSGHAFENPAVAAQWAYSQADAMLTERAKEE